MSKSTTLTPDAAKSGTFALGKDLTVHRMEMCIRDRPMALQCYHKKTKSKENVSDKTPLRRYLLRRSAAKALRHST